MFLKFNKDPRRPYEFLSMLNLGETELAKMLFSILAALV